MKLTDRLILKPCPFCGGHDLDIGRNNEDREGIPAYIFCGACGADGPWMYIRDMELLTDITLLSEATGWNKRTTTEGGHE